jgi:O-antigen/teichoic acid export membrane protein
LLRNSFYLALNAGTMAAVGFVFWLLNSHLYTAAQIGTATTLLSGASIISIVSLVGFNSTFVRFLPASRHRDEEINTGLLIVFATALIAATLYALFIPTIAPRLALIRGSFGFAAGFIVLTAFWGVNLVTDSVFIAFRKAQYNVLVDGIIQGAVKLALPVLLVGLGAYGMFLASGLAAAAAVVASIVFMFWTVGYRPKLSLSLDVLRRTWDYSAANYAANLLLLCPAAVIPLIVLDVRGPGQAGFYFIAFQVASLLFHVGYAVSASFFAEGSYEGSDLPALLRRSVRLIALVCVPCGVFVAATAHWLLLLFGRPYSANGTSTLAILALSTPLVAWCSTAMTLLRITKQLGAVIVASAVYAIATVGLALLGVGHGLQWVAVAWLLGNAAAGLLAAVLAAWHLRARAAG